MSWPGSRPRFPDLDPAEGGVIAIPSTGMVDVAEELRADDSGDSAATGGDPDADLLDGEGVLTGFRMQRLTCLLRLDATPKRRPQVSQTKATSVRSRVNGQMLPWNGYTYLSLRYVRGDAEDQKSEMMNELGHLFV